MMFAIDLLKGKELPEQINLKRSIFRAVPVLIPLLAISVFAAAYQHDKGQLKACQQTLKEQQQEVEQYAADVAEYETIQREVNANQKYLKDISKALSYRVQVSSILTELIHSLPESIFIYEMKMDRSSVMKKIQQEGSGEVKQKLAINRNLEVVLCGFDPDQTNMAVQEYLSRLRKSPILSEVFTEIRHSGQQPGQVDDKDAVYHEIECVLREQGAL